jgi:L-ascorbate metabolism protein UlaG (beta-lactamase superfamily)
MTGLKQRSWPRRVALGLGALLAFAVVGALVDGWKAFGRRADGERRERMEESPQWSDGRFVNPQPMVNDLWGSVTGAFNASADGSPSLPVPTVRGGHERFATPPPTGLRVTWLGHSTLLVEVDGYRILTDPVWGERVSPLSAVGPKRWYEPLLSLGELPRLDAVVISHDHYDHLDEPTLSAMKDWDTTFIVPLGVGAHLVYWGVPAERIVELDWWERTKVKGLEIVATPARHASGRLVIDTHATLWASYALIGPTHRVWFSGDTGMFPAMRDIGERLGPFDLTMIEAGAYGSAWPDWHLGPEQAVTAHQWVRGRVMLPVHWGLFNLAFHGWTEPAERVLAAARRSGVTAVIPKPGQSFEPGALPTFERWWPDLPWQTAEQNPIVATQMN